MSEVTTKRGLASSFVHSAFATTRRRRFQLLRVVHLKSLKRRAGLPVRRLCTASLIKLGLDFGDEPIVLRQPEEKVHAVCLAPSHQFLAREAAVGAHQNAHKRPTTANVGNDARHLLHRTGRGVDIRAPQFGGQQMANT